MVRVGIAKRFAFVLAIMLVVTQGQVFDFDSGDDWSEANCVDIDNAVWYEEEGLGYCLIYEGDALDRVTGDTVADATKCEGGCAVNGVCA